MAEYPLGAGNVWFWRRRPDRQDSYASVNGAFLLSLHDPRHTFHSVTKTEVKRTVMIPAQRSSSDGTLPSDQYSSTESTIPNRHLPSTDLTVATQRTTTKASNLKTSKSYSMK